MRAEMSTDAYKQVKEILNDEICVLRFLVEKEKIHYYKRLNDEQLKDILSYQEPTIKDPVFDFPKKDEMRRLKYNAKRRALDNNRTENLY
mmetsp:Transcript_82377/g.101057  ORF Transcript_82377/g.101057 Transcript_82377/m.101057 type:complete len:90 (-) Transcript_82377:40-309(-)